MVHLMFGLEGSGFIISISLTFLLVGLVVYLMKRQMRGLEQKFCSIFELSQNLATSIEHIKSTQKDRRKEVYIKNYSDSENDTDTDNEDTDNEDTDNEDTDNEDTDYEDIDCPGGICPINKMFESIKVIDINDNHDKPFNFENNALEEILNPDIKELNKNKEHNSHEQDLDEQNSDEQNSDEQDSDEQDSDDQDSDNEIYDEKDNSHETYIQNDSKHDDCRDEKNTVENTMVDEKKTFIQKNNPQNIIDYQKLKVLELRNLVVKQNILSEQKVKTIKKQELINLLKKNN